VDFETICRPLRWYWFCWFGSLFVGKFVGRSVFGEGRGVGTTRRWREILLGVAIYMGWKICWPKRVLGVVCETVCCWWRKIFVGWKICSLKRLLDLGQFVDG